MAQAWLRRIAIAYGVLFAVDSLINSFILAFQNVDWHTLTPQQKSITTALMLKGAIGTVLAYLSKQSQRIADSDKGENPNPLPDGGPPAGPVVTGGVVGDFPTSPPFPTQQPQPTTVTIKKGQ